MSEPRSVTIRLATMADAAAVQAIYAPFCEATAVSFEVVAPPVEEMAARIARISERLPWLVCDHGGTVAGYAYAAPHRERAAYRWSVDVTVYIANDYRRTGVGRGLYTSLFAILVAQGYYQAYAGVTLPNPGSVGLHEAIGFTLVGVYRNVGYKLGRWHDVAWWQRPLQPAVDDPPEPRGFSEIEDAIIATNLRDGAALVRLPVNT